MATWSSAGGTTEHPATSRSTATPKDGSAPPAPTRLAGRGAGRQPRGTACAGRQLARPHSRRDPLPGYVEDDWLPPKHLEATTTVSCVSNLTKHFLPFFGQMPMHQISPSIAASLGCTGPPRLRTRRKVGALTGQGAATAHLTNTSTGRVVRPRPAPG